MKEIVTSDRKMLELLALTKTVSQSKASVLIQGESGTGKELVAQLIHSQSARSSKAFISLYCGSIPENLLESELFGYERGSFTGAVHTKIGKLEQAHGGSLFLDEISGMDIKLQAKLLKFLQEGQVDRIGGSRPVGVDVRILSSTNKNISQLIKQGTFREDLFYRINVVNLTLPPLRDRKKDIPLLVDYFLKKISEEKGSVVAPVMSLEALDMLQEYNWPGNVRELENVLERALITSIGNEIRSSDVVIHQVEKSTSMPQGLINLKHPGGAQKWQPGTTLDDVERNVIIEALEFHHGNRTHTAKALGISIRTLRNKIADYKKLGLSL